MALIKKLAKLDFVFLASIFFLAGIGLLALYSISQADETASGLGNFTKQLMFVLLGLGVMIFFAFTDYHYLRPYSTTLYFTAVFLLLAVLVWGVDVRGTAGWISLGPFHIQPVEVAKLILIIFLSGFISQKRMELSESARLLVSFALASVIIFLVVRQPDFGSAVVLALIWMGMMAVCGLSRRTLVVLVLIVAALFLAGWNILEDYQKSRMINLVSPGIDPQGSGYNVIQSQIAVGSGGIIGKGVGHGSQSHLNFLPEKHNDFIFAVVAEELGLTGSLIVHRDGDLRLLQHGSEVDGCEL